MSPVDPDKKNEIIANARDYREKREAGYRERAMKLYPHVCARCGREFAGKTLRELTVHHKDHDHNNNPPDGSNWELLCLYCHDNEHEDQEQRESGSINPLQRDSETSLGFNAFEGLSDLLPPEE